MHLCMPIKEARSHLLNLKEIDNPLEVFQLPSGEYKLSQTQVAEAIGGLEANVRRFLASKSPEALPYKGFTPAKSEMITMFMPLPSERFCGAKCFAG